MEMTIKLEFEDKYDLKRFYKTIEDRLETIKYIEDVYGGNYNLYTDALMLNSVKNQLKKVIDD